MKKLNILLVEDNPGDAELIREMLAKKGADPFKIDQVSRLSEAIARIQKGDIDIVLLDLGLPDTGGLDTLIKFRNRAQHIPVIILTGYSDEEIAVTALREGAEDYLVKGQFSVSLLTRSIRYALERKNIKVQLEEQANFLRQLMDAIPMPIFFKDTNHVYQGCNKAFLESIGGPREGVVGKTVFQISSKELAEIYYNKDAELFSHPGIQVYESCVQYADGTPHDVLFTKATYTDREGNVAGLVGIILDISHRKRTEEERARLQNQLLQAQKMESVGRMAGGVAHDFNNMLGVVIGYAEMAVEKTNPADPIYDDLKEILLAATRSANLTRQLLAFARKQTLEIKPLDLNLAIKGFIKMLRRTLRENIDIQTHFSARLKAIDGDIGQIEQVIMNLAINAQDAMPNGGTFLIETSEVDLDETYTQTHIDVAPGHYVMMSVNDSGSGMDKQTLAQIFDPFFTTKELGKGTGLGLSTVFGIVKQHGGTITAYSEPGKGTVFKMFFPVKKSIADAQDIDPIKPQIAVQGTETILLAEDQDGVRNMASRILRSCGYTVLDAPNGKSAIDISKAFEGKIHILVTDVIMPDINGKELYLQLHKERPDLKVLYTSGYTADVISHHGVLEKDIKFIQKPFSISAFTIKVRETLEEI